MPNEFWDSIVDSPARLPGVPYDAYGRPDSSQLRFQTPMDFVRYVDSLGPNADPGSRRQADQIRRNPNAFEVIGPGAVREKQNLKKRDFIPAAAIAGAMFGGPALFSMFGGGGGAAAGASAAAGGAMPLSAATSIGGAAVSGMPFYVPGMGQALPAALAAENAVMGATHPLASLLGSGYKTAMNIPSVAGGGGNWLTRGLRSLGNKFIGRDGEGGLNLASAIWPSVTDAGMQIAVAKMLSDASKEAAEIQARSAREALDFEKERYGEAKTNFGPYLQAGTGAVNTLSSLLSTPRDYGDLMGFIAGKQNQSNRTVRMRAPTGEERDVPVGLVPMFQARGGEVMNG